MEKLNQIFKTLNLGFVEYNGNKIRIIIDKNDEIWFNAKDVVMSLAYKNLKEIIKKLVDKGDKIQLQYIKHNYNVNGIHPQSIYLSEAGLYSLIISSRLPEAKEFKNWITHDILPSIRKFGYYQSKQKYKSKIIDLKKENAYLQREKYKINQDCKKQKFPQGGVAYAIDYSTKREEIYRIGMTQDMKKRKKIYDTHTLHNQKVVIIKEFSCPLQLESCIKSLLFDYRYYYNGRIKKDFYKCSLGRLKASFNHCVKSIECIRKKQNNTSKSDSKKSSKQKGGSKSSNDYLQAYNHFFKNRMINVSNQIAKLEKKCRKLDTIIMKNVKK